jgi:hypothetical protein
LIIPLLFGPLMLFGGLLVMLEAPQSRGTGIVTLLVGFALTALGIRETRQRTVLIEITERGIMFYANADGICVSFSLRRDLFIPWERLESMRFLTLRQVIAEGLILVVGRGPVRPGCIALKLRMDPFWPPSGTLRQGLIIRRGRPGEIYFLTSGCSPGGRQLWSQIMSVVKKYGGRDIVLGTDKIGDQKR